MIFIGTVFSLCMGHSCYVSCASSAKHLDFGLYSFQEGDKCYGLYLTTEETTAMLRLAPGQCLRAVGHVKAGVAPQDGVLSFNCYISTIYCLQYRFITTGTTDDTLLVG